MHFAGSFTNLANRQGFSPYLAPLKFLNMADQIAKGLNGGVNPGIDFDYGASGNTVNFRPHANNEYSRHKVNEADVAFRRWLVKSGLTEDIHFTYTASATKQPRFGGSFGYKPVRTDSDIAVHVTELRKAGETGDIVSIKVTPADTKRRPTDLILTREQATAVQTTLAEVVAGRHEALETGDVVAVRIFHGDAKKRPTDLLLRGDEAASVLKTAKAQRTVWTEMTSMGPCDNGIIEPGEDNG